MAPKVAIKHEESQRSPSLLINYYINIASVVTHLIMICIIIIIIPKLVIPFASCRSVVFQAQDVIDYDVTYGEQEPDIAGETYVSFGNDAVSDQQTETDVKELEGKHKMSLQQMKEQILGSVSLKRMAVYLVPQFGGETNDHIGISSQLVRAELLV